MECQVPTKISHTNSLQSLCPAAYLQGLTAEMHRILKYIHGQIFLKSDFSCGRESIRLKNFSDFGFCIRTGLGEDFTRWLWA